MENTIMFKEINEQIERIIPCYEYNKAILEKLGNIIKDFNPSNIMIVARGTSMHSGVYAKYQFERYFKIPVSIAAPSIFTVYDTNLNLSQTLVIAISQSGKGLDILEGVKKANKNGALTVAITNEPDSLVAKEAQYHLYCNANKAISIPATKTFTTTMYLISKLLYQITLNHELNLDETKVVNALQNGLNIFNNYKNITNSLKKVNHTIILARGYSLSLAMETALKIKETSYYETSAYPISEFYHGPIAILNDEMPIIVFDIDNVTRKNVDELFHKTSHINNSKILITNNPNLNINIPDKIIINDIDKYALFSAIIILQLLSLDLSIKRGNQPDFKEILNSVNTI